MNRILYIGGWTRDKNSYKKFFDCVPDDTEVLFLPCYDILDKNPPKESADYIYNFLEKNNVDKIAVAGHSLGGGLAIEFALKYPKMVKKLYLIDTAGFLCKQPFYINVKGAIRDQLKNAKEKAKENLTTTLRIFSRPIKNYNSLAIAYSYDLGDRVKDIKIPTTIFWGEEDHIYPLELGEKINHLIENSKLVKFKDMDHDWIVHQPEYFWKNI